MAFLVTNALKDMNNGRFQKAYSKLSKVVWEELSLEEENEGRYLFGITLGEVGKFEESEAQFEILSKKEPLESKVLVAWGVTIDKVGELDEAVLKFQAALEIDIFNWDAFYQWGDLLVREGKWEEGAEKYESALNLNPSSLDILISLGSLKCLLGEFETAEELFRKGLEEKPSNPVLHFWLGNIFDVQGREKDAISFYDKALQLDPMSPEPYESWGMILHRNGNSSQALEILEKGFSHLGRHPGICLAMAQVLLDMGRFHEALSMGEGAIAELELEEEESENRDEVEELLALVHNKVGKILEAIGEMEEAEEHYYLSVAALPVMKEGFLGIASLRGIYRENHWEWEVVISLVLQEDETEFPCFQSFEVAALNEEEAEQFIKEYLERTSGEYFKYFNIIEAKRKEQKACYAGILAASEKVAVEAIYEEENGNIVPIDSEEVKRRGRKKKK